MQKTIILAALLLFTFAPTAQASPDCGFHPKYFFSPDPTGGYLFWAGDVGCFAANTVPIPSQVDDVVEYSEELLDWTVDTAVCPVNTAPIGWVSCASIPPTP